MRQSNRIGTSAVSGHRSNDLGGNFKVKHKAKISGQDKLALGFTVPPFITHLHTIAFILEPSKN